MCASRLARLLLRFASIQPYDARGPSPLAAVLRQ